MVVGAPTQHSDNDDDGDDTQRQVELYASRTFRCVLSRLGVRGDDRSWYLFCHFQEPTACKRRRVLRLNSRPQQDASLVTDLTSLNAKT